MEIFLKENGEVDMALDMELDTNKKIIMEMRAKLPGQRVASVLELAETQFGKSYGYREIYNKVRKTIPFHPFFFRYTLWSGIDLFTKIIPDEALLKLHNAIQSKYFSGFYVLEPYYGCQLSEIDPWLVGKVIGTNKYIVIAQWL